MQKASRDTSVAAKPPKPSTGDGTLLKNFVIKKAFYISQRTRHKRQNAAALTGPTRRFWARCIAHIDRKKACQRDRRPPHPRRPRGAPGHSPGASLGPAADTSHALPLWPPAAADAARSAGRGPAAAIG
ncbi:hypothetical protein V5799_003977, partial [Amblyomma americanum]